MIAPGLRPLGLRGPRQLSDASRLSPDTPQLGEGPFPGSKASAREASRRRKEGVASVPTVKSLDDLVEVQRRAHDALTLRAGPPRARVVVGMGICGIAAGARSVVQAVLAELAAQGLSDVAVIQSGCKGLCNSEPMVSVELPGQAPVTYGRVSPDIARRIVTQHVIGGQPLSDYIVS